MTIDRRSLLKYAAVAPALGTVPHFARAADDPPTEKADYTLRIALISFELAPGKTIKTTGYNGKVPGPVLRLREGRPVTINVINDAGYPDIVHWHGLYLPPLQDGATEEGSPIIPVGQSLVYSFTPKPTGTRWYHSHAMAMKDLTRSTYSGEFGFLILSRRRESAAAMIVRCFWPPVAGTASGSACKTCVKGRRRITAWRSCIVRRRLGSGCSGTTNQSVYGKASAFYFVSSMPARPWTFRWHCQAIASPSSRLMAIPFRRQRL